MFSQRHLWLSLVGALILSSCAKSRIDTPQAETANAREPRSDTAAAPIQPAEPPGPEQLAAELLEMKRVDQGIRNRLIAAGPATPDQALVAELLTTDRRHTARLKQIIDAYGWPRVSLVGEEASNAAWLIAQHADLDLAFQQRVLELIEPLAKTGEVDPSNFAYLTDRVRVKQGRNQVYGTQYRIVEHNGRVIFEPSTPIEDTRALNARRALMGLGSHAEYLAALREVYAANQASLPAPQKRD